jgi:hypothetical protein
LSDYPTPPTVLNFLAFLLVIENDEIAALLAPFFFSVVTGFVLVFLSTGFALIFLFSAALMDFGAGGALGADKDLALVFDRFPGVVESF